MCCLTFIHKWNEPYLPLLPSRTASPHFGLYSFSVRMRIGGWVGLGSLMKYWGGLPAWRRSPIPLESQIQGHNRLASHPLIDNCCYSTSCYVTARQFWVYFCIIEWTEWANVFLVQAHLVVLDKGPLNVVLRVCMVEKSNVSGMLMKKVLKPDLLQGCFF